MRLFLAIDLPPEVKTELSRQQELIASLGAGGAWHWSKQQDLHLTLVFLGETEPANLSSIQDLVSLVARNTCAIHMDLAGFGGFPQSDAARVFWVGIQEAAGHQAGSLRALAQELRKELDLRRFSYDPKPLRPHITLARRSKPQAIPRCAEPPPLGFLADAITLFESQTDRRGQPYRKLGVYPLGLRC